MTEPKIVEDGLPWEKAFRKDWCFWETATTRTDLHPAHALGEGELDGDCTCIRMFCRPGFAAWPGLLNNSCCPGGQLPSDTSPVVERLFLNLRTTEPHKYWDILSDVAVDLSVSMSSRAYVRADLMLSGENMGTRVHTLAHSVRIAPYHNLMVAVYIGERAHRILSRIKNGGSREATLTVGIGGYYDWKAL
jgi:hypothetical protein